MPVTLGLRFILGMANGALVVSEPVFDAFPLVAGRHYISASLEEMPAAILYYLNNQSDRQRIVDEAHSFVTTELTTERSVLRLLDLLSQKEP